MLFLSLISAGPARAEYRVFILRIAKKSAPQDFRLVQSTLDPLQYPYLHPVAADEIVTYDDTWRCHGRTGDFKPLCPNPREPAQESTSQRPENGPPTTPP